MASAGIRAAKKEQALLAAPGGLADNIAALAELEQTTLPEFTLRQLVAANVAQELIEQATAVKFPAVHVFCEKIANTLREKFRTFSGKVFMVVEVRVSQDRLEGLERAMQIYVDAVMRVLDQHRGDWGEGMFYTGGYDAQFGPVKHGGRNFIQTAVVRFEVQVSID